MLNRRNLRIKVMQSLFAFHQSRDANYLLALDRISDTFSPDLNSMIQPDRKELEEKKRQAQELFKKVFPNRSLPVEHSLAEIRQAVQDALQFYDQAVQKDFTWFKTNLVSEVERLDQHYLSVLSLTLALADAASADKKINHRNFTGNPWIVALRQVPEVVQKQETMWSSRQGLVKQWLRDVLKADAEYMEWLDRKEIQPEEQRKMIMHIFRKLILGKTLISEYYEAEILRWTEDREIVKGMVEKTIKSWSPDSNQPLQLHALSLTWEDDRDFIEKLFTGAAFLPEDYHHRIAKNMRNWEIDRLPLTDRVILELAVTEMVSFPSIPVKVTINEYIELAKNYSTPKSRQFINGILDVLAKELTHDGLIRKSGRGLIDNK
jgi:N utilization substance protein B